VEFSVEFVDERGDKLRRHHSLPEALQDPRLDLVASDAKSIRAGAFGAACCASVPVGPDDRVCAATTTADDEAAQQVAAAMSTVESISLFVAADLESGLLLPCLNSCPQAVIDDPQIWNLDDLPLAAGVRPRDPLASARILDVAAPGSIRGARHRVRY